MTSVVGRVLTPGGIVKGSRFGGAHVSFWHEADITIHKAHVRLVPEPDPMDQSRAAKKPQPSEQSKVVRRDDPGLSAYFLLASTRPCEPIHVACVW